MAVTKIKINGTFIDASTVTRRMQRLGTVLTAQNGSRRFALRAVKSTWEISCEQISAADVATLKTAYALGSTFTLIDETNTSFTVFCADDPLEIATGIQTPDLATMYYTVSMTVKEA